MPDDTSGQLNVRSRIGGVFLASSSAEFELSKKSSAGQLDYGLDMTVNGMFEESSRTLKVSVQGKLEIFQAGADESYSADRLGVVDVTYELMIEIHEEDASNVTEEAAQEFAASRGLPMVYPYIRQYLSDTTGRAGMPPLFVPVLEQATINGQSGD